MLATEFNAGNAGEKGFSAGDAGRNVFCRHHRCCNVLEMLAMRAKQFHAELADNGGIGGERDGVGNVFPLMHQAMLFC